MTYAVIMAGGIGSRFWPKSRQATPKQFLNVFGEATLIQNTVARLAGFVPPERCLIVTNADYVDLVRDQLPTVPPENVLAEPMARNTAPCIAFAAWTLAERDPNATMIVLPADHVITNVRAFHRVLETAVAKAQDPGTIVTLGIEPTHPATGYGYIQYEGEGNGSEEPCALPVKTFAEKPDLATAERFLDSGDFVWNSGMFIWRVDTTIDAFAKYMPDIHEAFEATRGQLDQPDALRTAFERSPKESIDYGVMEQAERVFVVPASFGWNDVGDWRAVYDLSEQSEQGNAVQGNVLLHSSSRCLAHSDGRLVVLVGVHDLAVVDTDDAVLVCSLERTQDVKHVVNHLHANQLEQYV